MPFVSFALSWTVGSIRLAHFLPLSLSLPLILYFYISYFKEWKNESKLPLMPNTGRGTHLFSDIHF